MNKIGYTRICKTKKVIFVLTYHSFALSLQKINNRMTPSEFIGKFKSKYLWSNLLAMGIVLVLLFLGVRYGLDIYTHHGESILVPDLKHKSISDAEKVLRHLGIEMVVSDTGYVKTLPPDCVLEQSLEPGERVKSGHRIYLVINSSHSPTLTIPDIIDNSSLREATAKLTSMGFKLGQPKFIPGEKDWVYGVQVKGVNINSGDKVSVEDVLVIVAGNGRLSEEDSINMVEQDYDDFDSFEEATGDDEVRDYDPMEEQAEPKAEQHTEKQHQGTTPKQENSSSQQPAKGPVVRKIG